MISNILKILCFAAFMAQTSARSKVENLEGLCTPENDPGCDHICVMNPLYGALCNCHFGYKLYEDKKTCVLTREILEAGERELEENYAVPVAIICLVGALVIFIMSAVTWYCVTRTPETSHNGSVIVSYY
ncbi:unnamed protein product [Oikopleura dioica]|uniref:EGF-like domain-containing protein n=2 Tax=Oikopleura dioica TaxID=34765 RepID=E4XKI6_OIKDI|nr:unnamed protein product [Oikopleura dioica]